MNHWPQVCVLPLTLPPIIQWNLGHEIGLCHSQVLPSSLYLLIHFSFEVIRPANLSYQNFDGPLLLRSTSFFFHQFLTATLLPTRSGWQFHAAYSSTGTPFPPWVRAPDPVGFLFSSVPHRHPAPSRNPVPQRVRAPDPAGFLLPMVPYRHLAPSWVWMTVPCCLAFHRNLVPQWVRAPAPVSNIVSPPPLELEFQCQSSLVSPCQKPKAPHHLHHPRASTIKNAFEYKTHIPHMAEWTNPCQPHSIHCTLQVYCVAVHQH